MEAQNEEEFQNIKTQNDPDFEDQEEDIQFDIKNNENQEPGKILQEIQKLEKDSDSSDEEEEDKSDDFQKQIFEQVYDCLKEIEKLEIDGEIQGEYQKPLLKVVELTHSIIEKSQSLIMKFASFEERTTTLSKIIKIHTVLMIQITMICEYIKYKKNQKNFSYIYQKYSNLGNYRVFVKSIKNFNFKEMKNGMGIIELKCLQTIEENCQILINVPIKDKQIVQEAFNSIKISASKLNTIVEILPFAVIFQKTDLFSLNQADPEWQDLLKCCNIKQIGNQEQIEQAYTVIIRGILSANAMVHKKSESKNNIMKSLIDKFGVFTYFLADEKAKQRSELFFAEASNQNGAEVISVWNYMESGATQQGIRFAFPSIKYVQQIYIERCAPQITKEFILQEVKQNKLNKRNPEPLNPNQISIAFNPEGGENQYYQNLFEPNNEKICIRILCSETLERPHGGEPNNENESGFFDKMKNVFTSKPKPNFQKIIIHIHGGGFVAMSSRTHQTYTRKWANEIGVPIFSIDYRKAPEFPYPCGLDDVWQSYNWILNFVEKFFNISPQRIVLVGDSAGGNLVASLTLMCIKMGIRKPDGILLVYPALNLNIEHYTPSMMLALDDIILPHTFLKICLHSYVDKQGGFLPSIDPFLSPIRASDQLLKELPPTRMLVGTNDPLHDECWRFLQRIKNNEIDRKMTIYNYLGHGFLNFDSPAMPQAAVCNKDAVNYLKELLQIN